MKAKLKAEQENHNDGKVINISIVRRNIPLDDIKLDFVKISTKFKLPSIGGGLYNTNAKFVDAQGAITEFGGMIVPISEFREVRKEFNSLEYEFDN